MAHPTPPRSHHTVRERPKRRALGPVLAMLVHRALPRLELRVPRPGLGGLVTANPELMALVHRRLGRARALAVQRHREFSRGLVASLQDGFMVSSAADGAIGDVNPRLCEMTGFSREELLGRHPPYPFWPPEEAPALEASLARVLNGVGGEYDHVLQRWNGERFPVIVSWSPLRDAAGRVSAAIAILKDITERKRAEELLHESEEQYRTVTDTASDAIISVDEESRILFANRATEWLFGHPREMLRGQDMATLMPDLRLVHGAGRGRYLVSGARRISWDVSELRGLHRDGQEIPIEVSFGQNVRDGHPIFTGIIRDITERKQAEEAARQSEEELRQSQKMEAVGRLAGGVAHDFNNLLTAISGYTELLLDDVPAIDPLRPGLEEIQKAAERAAALTRQLLAFSRRQVLETRVLDLDRVVGELEPMLHRLVGEDVQLRVVLGAGSRPVLADPSQLEQVVMNLVLNAGDAMPCGGRLTVETHLVDFSEADARMHQEVVPGAYVMLAVSDTGIGMAAATQEHIFEPFFTTKERDKGTGLGLAAVYGVVAQSGGTIEVYSEEGHGSTFKIYLPAAASPIESEVPAVAPGTARGGSETILLVEDDRAVRALAQQALERYGYRVLSAPGAALALELGRAHLEQIDLLLTDVVMSDVGGRELAEAMHELRPDLGILYMSGYTADAMLHTGALNGDAEFLAKPFSPDGLARKVRHVLDRGGDPDSAAPRAASSTGS